MRLTSSSTVSWVGSECGFNEFGSVDVSTGARSSGLRSIVFCCPALFEIAVCRCPGIQRFKVNLALVAGSVPKFKTPILDSAERAETFAISLHNIQWAHTWVSAGCNIRLSSMCGFAFLPAPLGMVRSIASGACNLVEISSLCRFFPFTCLVCVRPPRNVSTVFSPGHYVYSYLQKAPPLVNSLSSL